METEEEEEAQTNKINNKKIKENNDILKKLVRFW